jgi:ElaB/YqjD/DUF883 family membrane-anchored ribosome-binding protein
MPNEESTTSLDAVELKRALWETLQGVRSGTITPQSADAIASQAREILRTVRTQLSVFQQAAEKVSKELIDFAHP